MKNKYMEHISKSLLPVNKTYEGLGTNGEHAHTVENPWGLHFHADGTLGGSHVHMPVNPMGVHTHGISPLRGGGHLHGEEATQADLNPNGSHAHANDEDTKKKITPKNSGLSQQDLASIIFSKGE